MAQTEKRCRGELEEHLVAKAREVDEARVALQKAPRTGLGLGFRVWGLGFRVWALGFRVYGSHKLFSNPWRISGTRFPRRHTYRSLLSSHKPCNP